MEMLSDMSAADWGRVQSVCLDEAYDLTLVWCDAVAGIGACGWGQAVEATPRETSRPFSLTTEQAIVESIERGVLQPATQARDTVARTCRSGASSLVEFLDARRAFGGTPPSYHETRADYRRAAMKLDVTLGKEVTAS